MISYVCFQNSMKLIFSNILIGKYIVNQSARIHSNSSGTIDNWYKYRLKRKEKK